MSDVHAPLWQRLAWYACGALVLSLLPVLKYAELWGALARPQKLSLLLVVGAFGAACLLSLLLDRGASWRNAGVTLVRSFAVLSLFLIAAAALSISLPRYLLIPLVMAIAVVVPLAISPLGVRRLPVVAGLVLAIGLAAYSLTHVHASAGAEQITRDAYFNTAFYPLKAILREGWIPEPATRGGGMSLLGDRVLLATGDGHLYVIDAPAQRAGFKVTELPAQVPLNREAFAKAFGGSARQPKRSRDWHEEGAPKVQTWRFRVADVATALDGDNVRIFASHHYWKAQDECVAVRVSELTVPMRNLEQSISQGQWSTLYETTPCVPLKGPNRKRGKNPFKGEEVGGEMLLLDANRLLLTLGDQGFSGIESSQAFSQDTTTDYGKTLLIDLTTRERTIFTMGHRNPQGIARGSDGKLWLTEHGPQGGDELNLLQEHANFGWPNVTYGTEYGATAWPLSAAQNRHADYRQPTTAWVPSVGVSDLAVLGDKLFPIWADNLLVGSLSTRSLYRLAVAEDRVVVQEPIALNKRVREILQLTDGRLLIWSDDASLTTLELSAGQDGATLFATQCLGCHAIVDGQSHRIGPDLLGIVGRRIGQAEGFDEYSPAMRAQSGSWDAARLDKFLQQPQAGVPGTSMAFPGIAAAEHRQAIIEYLRSPPDTEQRDH